MAVDAACMDGPHVGCQDCSETSRFRMWGLGRCPSPRVHPKQLSGFFFLSFRLSLMLLLCLSVLTCAARRPMPWHSMAERVHELWANCSHQGRPALEEQTGELCPQTRPSTPDDRGPVDHLGVAVVARSQRAPKQDYPNHTVASTAWLISLV